MPGPAAAVAGTTFDLLAFMQTHLMTLCNAGQGWHCYALDQAQRWEAEYPDYYPGLTQWLKTQLGPEAVAQARRDYMEMMK